MTPQDKVWIISLIFIALVAAIFAFVVTQTSVISDAARTRRTHRRSDRLRVTVFGLLVLVFALVSWFTLWHFPLPAQHGPLDAKQTINVVAHQWYWILSAHKVDADVPVEFRVTSEDVNHDFAVYDAQGRLVVQTQAMPGYENKILYTFKHPGTYRIRCLEYCGLGHTAMTSEFTVVAHHTGKHST